MRVDGILCLDRCTPPILPEAISLCPVIYGTVDVLSAPYIQFRRSFVTQQSVPRRAREPDSQRVSARHTTEILMLTRQLRIGPVLVVLVAAAGVSSVVRETRSETSQSGMRCDGQFECTEERLLKSSRSVPETAEMGATKSPEAMISELAQRGDGYRFRQPRGLLPPDESVATIVVPIGDNKSITVQRVRSTTTIEGRTWNGIVKETGESALLMWWKDGRLTGMLGYKGRIYTLTNAGGEVHAEIETHPRNMRDRAFASTTRSANSQLGDNSHLEARTGQKTPAAPIPPSVRPFSQVERRALEAKKITIDLMILYTKKAETRYIISLAELVARAVEETNGSFRNSGLENISLRLVHTQLLDYDETDGEHFEHLYRMVDGVGPFKGVRKLRDEKHADIVGMIVEDPSGCGLSTRVAADAEEAYFVVHHSCAAITFSIGHEVGHILGARHDRQIDAINSPFPYGHGYVNGKKWRDIMSYQQSCDGCPRIPYWSNPRIKYNGEATGTAANDNARVVLEQAGRVANFR